MEVKSLNNTDPDIWKDLMESYVHDSGNEPSDAETISSVTSTSSVITDDEEEDSSTSESDEFLSPERSKQSPFFGEENNGGNEWYSLKKCNKYIPARNNISDQQSRDVQNAVTEKKQTCQVKRIKPCPVSGAHYKNNKASIQPVVLIRPMVDGKSYENQKARVSPYRPNNHRDISRALHQFQNVSSNDMVPNDHQVNDITILPASQNSAIVSNDSIVPIASKTLTALHEKSTITNESQCDIHLLPSKNLENEKTAFRRHVKPIKMLNEKSKIRSQTNDIGMARHQVLSSNHEVSLPIQMCDKIEVQKTSDNFQSRNSQFKNNLPTNISKRRWQSPRCDQTYVVSKNTFSSYHDDTLSYNSKDSPSTCMAALKLKTQSPSGMITTSPATINDSSDCDLTPRRQNLNLIKERTLESDNSPNRKRLVIKSKDDMIFSKHPTNPSLLAKPLIKRKSLDLVASPPRCRASTRQRPQQSSTISDSSLSLSNSVADDNSSLIRQTHLQTQFEQMFQSLFPKGLLDGHIKDKHISPLKTLAKKDEVQTVGSPYDRKKITKVPSSHVKDDDSFSPSRKQAEALIILEQMMSHKNVQRNYESKSKRTSRLLAKESEISYNMGDITTSTDSNRMKPRSSPKRPLSRSLKCKSDNNIQKYCGHSGSSPVKERRITSSISDSREQIDLQNNVTHDGFVVPQSFHIKKLHLIKNREKPPSQRYVDQSFYDWKPNTSPNYSHSTITNHGWCQSHNGTSFHTSTPMKKSVPQSSDMDSSILSICSEIPTHQEL